MPRSDGRGSREHRPVEMVTGFHRNAEGSVLYRAGNTVVLCTASIDDSVPPWMVGKGSGWITAEYQMHPRSGPQKRENRDGRGKAPSGRTQEIQRLIGRALRSAVSLELLGERSISIDCDVLEADGGTRTASITGGFVALSLALAKLTKLGKVTRPVLRDQVAAISVGYLEAAGAENFEESLALDLVYVEDSKARVDLNLVGTATGAIVEVQGTAEGEAIPRATLDRMIDVAMGGVLSLCELQRQVIAGTGVEMAALLVPKKS